MISPCVDILRRLATHINSTLGAQQGTKHASPSLDRDIGHLMASLRRFRVYELDPGRDIDDGTDSDAVVADSLTVGLQRLSEPLADFNASFAKLKARCSGQPLLGGKYAGVHTDIRRDTESSVRLAFASGNAGTAEGVDTDDKDDASGSDGDETSDGEDEDLEPQGLMSLD